MIEAVFAAVPAILTSEPVSEELILTLPDGVRRMISAAVRLEDEAQLQAVLNAAQLAYPTHKAAIEAYVEELQQPSEPLTVAPHVITAQPPEPPIYSFLENLEGRIHANAAYTEGNTETSVLGARIDASAKIKTRIHRLEAYANLGSANQQRTQENWGTSYQMDTLWTEDVFGYVRASIESDAFSGFDYRSFVGAGAGYYFVQDETLSLRGEVGPGYRYSREDQTGEDVHDWVLYGAIDTQFDLIKGWQLGHDSKITLSRPGTSASSRSHLSTALTEALRAGIAYELQFEQNPPSEKDQFDTVLKLDVSYGF